MDAKVNLELHYDEIGLDARTQMTVIWERNSDGTSVEARVITTLLTGVELILSENHSLSDEDSKWVEKHLTKERR